MAVRNVRNKVAHVRLSETEFAALSSVASAVDLSVSEILRRLARSYAGLGPSFEGETRQRIRDMTVQMRAIGVNINQVARLMNSGRVPDDEHMRVSFGLLLDLLNEQQDFLLDLCVRERSRVCNADADPAQPDEL